MSLARRRLPFWAVALCLAGFAGSIRMDALRQSGAMVNAAERAPEDEGEAEHHEQSYKVINFLLLAGGLVFLLRKPFQQFLAQRSAAIHKGLEEGRKALEASQARLAAVEEKLRHLEEEIAAFKASAAREMEAERQRLREAADQETERILQLAQAEMERATRAAKLELKAYTAQQAIELAEQIIRQRVDDSIRKRQLSRFMDELSVHRQRPTTGSLNA